MKVHSVVFIHWSGDFKRGSDESGYYCLPTRYYVYMPVRICNFSTYQSEEEADTSEAPIAGIQYDLDDKLTRHGEWNVPTMHFDEVYNQSHFLRSLLLTPRKFWPTSHQFEHIAYVQKNFNYYNRYTSQLDTPF